MRLSGPVATVTSVSHRAARSAGAALAMAGGCFFALAACSSPASSGNSSVPTGNEATSISSEACPDGSGRLPITGLCSRRAVNYLNPAGGAPPAAPQGCDWIVQETQFVEQVLLYRALKCGDKVTKLAFAAGQMAELSYESGALGDMGDTIVARIGSIANNDPRATILANARSAITDPAERAKCSVRLANQDGWPSDALVVDVSPREAARAPADEPRAACGPMGFNGDEASFWRAFQGHVWFFQLGQDLAQIDPGSFTLMKKESSGEWTQS